MKELILKGHVYLAMSPLYKITKGKNFEYLLNLEELNAYKEKHKNEKYEIGYVKGLGELDPAELKSTTLNIQNRRLKQIYIENENEVAKMFNELMGTSVTSRKKFIEDNATVESILI